METRISRILEMIDSLRELIELDQVVNDLDVQIKVENKPKRYSLDQLKKMSRINGLVKDMPSKLQQAEAVIEDVEQKARIEKLRQEISNYYCLFQNRKVGFYGRG